MVIRGGSVSTPSYGVDVARASDDSNSFEWVTMVDFEELAGGGESLATGYWVLSLRLMLASVVDTDGDWYGLSVNGYSSGNFPCFTSSQYA